MGVLADFIKENESVGGITLNQVKDLRNLVDKYKLPKLVKDCSVLNADFGVLGSVVVYGIGDFEPKVFKYISGDYDYISCVCNKTTKILWTDFKDIEPYNRQSGLYCGGASFEHLGDAVFIGESYREFNTEYTSGHGFSFGMGGFRYNSFYKTVSFGVCLNNSDVEHFISEIRRIINKPKSI